MRPALFLLPLALALLPGCLSTTRRVSMGDDGTTLAATRLEGDSEVEWTLYASGRSGEPKLGRTTTRTSQVAYVGLSVRSLDAKLAESLGVEPWRGVQVTRVLEDSASGRAGLRVHDIVLSIGGAALTSDAQFIERVQTSATPHEGITFALLRDAGPESEGHLLELELVPEARPLTETRTDSFKLATEPELLECSGLQLATIPAEYAQPIYAEPTSVAVVSGVIVGSPAYAAGLRGGDRVLRCNGQAVSTAGEVRELLRPPAVDGSSSDGSSERLDLEVVGPLGPHRAKVEVVKDVYSRSSLNIPIVFDCSSSVDRRRWSFLDFILQFGANYSSRQLPSATREPLSEWDLSILPFGMFEFARSPGRSSTRLFWFIRFRTS